MGQFLSRKRKEKKPLRELRTLFLGLDDSGKSTMVYTLKFGTQVTTRTTIGFNMESLIYEDTEFNVIDIGGSSQIRPLWKHYYENVDVIVFVIDCQNESRFKEARSALDSVLVEPQLKQAPLLVLANKSDKSGAKSAKEMEQILLLPNSGRKYHVLSCSAIYGTGLLEGFIWLNDIFNQRDKAASTIAPKKTKKRENGTLP